MAVGHTTTDTTLDAMINEYLPNKLLADELIKRDWFLSNVNKDQKWLGGDIIVPFLGAMATSVKFGGLTAETDVAAFQYARGKLSGYKEAWGTLVFNHTDIMKHGKVDEQNFVKILPDQLEMFLQYFKMLASINLLCGPHFATVTAEASAASGLLTVDRVDRFEIGQKVCLAGTNAGYFYVTAINVNTSVITLSLTRGGEAANLTSCTPTGSSNGAKDYTAGTEKFYHEGVVTGTISGNDIATPVVEGQFTSVKSALLSNANGGSANLHGVAKTAWPYLQAINISGSDITASNILEKLFDAYTAIKIKAKAGSMNKCVMSYKHLASCMKALEDVKGSFKVAAKDTRASVYDWTEIDVVGVKGGFTLVGIQEMDDDVIMFLDMSAFTFRSNGMFQKRTSPDGKQYFELRATTGFKYLIDFCLFGELEVTKPASCGIIHSISY